MRMRTVAPLVIAASCAPLPVTAQPPGTDIHIAPFRAGADGIIVGTPVNVTSRPGYDNQPWFSDDGTWFLFASIDSSGQSDIFRYDFATRETSRVTATPESEYSPTLLPGGHGFSSVRVELDGRQRLWRFDEDGSDPRLVLADVDSVGYHAWTSDSALALFIVGQPHSLRTVDLRDGRERLIALDIGRGLGMIPGTGNLCFMRRVVGSSWRLDGLDPATGETWEIGRALDGSEDFAWTATGRILMVQRRTLYGFNPGSDGGWRKIVTFGGPELEEITRLRVSPAGDRIALVGAE